MNKTQGKLSVAENIFYYVSVVLSCGGTWLLKIVYKKAMIEAQK